MIKKIIITSLIFCGIGIFWFFQDFIKSFFLKSEEIVIEKDFSEEIAKEEQGEGLTLSETALATGNIKKDFKKEENKIVYYNQNNFLETDLEGSFKKTLSSYPFVNLEKIDCLKTGKICLIKADEKYSIYNLETKNIVNLDQKITEVEFNYLGDGLVYSFFQNNNKYELNTSTLEGNNWNLISEINEENLNFSVNPKKNQVVYFSRKVDKKKSGIFLTELISQAQAQKIVEDDIIDVLWSPMGDKLLFSFYDHSVAPKRVQLGYYDFIGKKQYKIGLPTIAEKCVWSEDSQFLYCGVLTSSASNEFDFENWEAGSFVSSDLFWKVDLSNNKKERIFNDFKKYPGVDSFNLILVEEDLLFIDKISGNLIKREL